MNNVSVIAHVDKTVLKIKGLSIKGLKPYEVEQVLSQKLERPVRVIGVTGDSLEMDIYGIDPELILQDEQGIIRAVSAVEGISAEELTKIDKAEKIISVYINNLPDSNKSGCAKERWHTLDK